MPRWLVFEKCFRRLTNLSRNYFENFEPVQFVKEIRGRASSRKVRGSLEARIIYDKFLLILIDPREAEAGSWLVEEFLNAIARWGSWNYFENRVCFLKKFAKIVVWSWTSCLSLRMTLNEPSRLTRGRWSTLLVEEFPECGYVNFEKFQMLKALARRSTFRIFDDFRQKCFCKRGREKISASEASNRTLEGDKTCTRFRFDIRQLLSLSVAIRPVYWSLGSLLVSWNGLYLVRGLNDRNDSAFELKVL